MEQPGTNWSGSLAYTARGVVRPTSIEQLQDHVATSPRVRPIGSRHSFSRIGDTTGTLVSVADLPGTVRLDPDTATVRVPAGATYGDICRVLDHQGRGLANLASLPHISVAGATATATHGSGLRNQNLSAAVTELTFVDGTGELMTVSRATDPELVPGCVVHLGALGIVTEVALATVPAFRVAQAAHPGIAVEDLAANFTDVMGCAHSVSVFTRWQGSDTDFVLVKAIVDSGQVDGSHPHLPTDVLGAPGAHEPLHPIPGALTDALTAQLGVPGPWYDRLPHFRLGHVPSGGAEIQSEFFVPLHRAPEAIGAIRAIGPILDDVLMVSEIRVVAADDLWLSPAYQQDVAAFHFTWHLDVPAITQAATTVAAALAGCEAVPHWGKVFTTGRDVFANRFLRLPEFRALAARFDPDGRLRNDFLDTLVL